MEAWKSLSAAMKKLKASKENVRAFKRFVFGSASEVEFDKQGRILIPGTLRTYAGLKKDVTVLGTGEKIEIWNKEAYDEYAAKIVPDMEEIAESLDETLDLDF
jgi:MraZ protein